MFIANHFSSHHAVDLYFDLKIWKYAHRNSEEKQYLPIKDYLIKKMNHFIPLFHQEQQEIVKGLFLKKINKLDPKSVRVNPEKYDRQELISRIQKRFEESFPQLIHENGHEMHYWKHENSEDFVLFKWTLGKDFPAPRLTIDALKISENLKKQGIATQLLKILVEELQRRPDPLSSIKVSALTGPSNFYGQATGAFAWARLGFEYDEPHKKTPADGYRSPSQHEQLESNFQIILSNPPANFIDQIFADKTTDKELTDEDIQSLKDEILKVLEKAKEVVKHLHYPWDVANMTIDGYPIGKYLMSHFSIASYEGVLYPNIPQSPGMLQYSKRMEELDYFYSP